MEEAQCAQCHRKIDPIGFGLENFNAAGKWREVDYDPKTKKEWPIDPAGAFHNGPAFNDYFELRDLIAAREGDSTFPVSTCSRRSGHEGRRSKTIPQHAALLWASLRRGFVAL